MDPAESSLELVLVTSDSVTARALPPGGAVTIGRAEECDVRVDDPAVSRRHAVLHVGPPLEIEDLGGANGTQLRPPSPHADPRTTVNLRRLSRERARLHVGDAIVVGGAVAVVRRAPPPVESVAGDGDVVVAAPAMRAVYDQATRAAQALLPVLILGETGVGKDVLARWIHRASPRARRPFLALNCAALSETLLESELFGHEKGAFTGAIGARPGLIESADGGTVFLDEVGDLPAAVQVKLLRVIEQREVLRVGARSPRAVDVRFVSATNRDLEAASVAGTFRQDLYFRLNGISLTVPPLRERAMEIAPLARRMLAACSRLVDLAEPPTLSSAALAALEAYSWPGNVRELRNAIERAAVLADRGVILPEHLPPKVAAGNAPSRPPPPMPPGPRTPEELDRARREWKAAERARIVEALARCDGNQTRAAELLGISRRTLINRLEEYALERPRKRTS